MPVTVTRPTPGAAILPSRTYASFLSFMVAGQATGVTSSDGQEFPVTRISTKIDDGEEIFIRDLNHGFSFSYFTWLAIDAPGFYVLHVTAYIDGLPHDGIQRHTVDVPIVVVGEWNMLAALYDRNAREMDFVAFDLGGALILDHTNPFLGFNTWDLVVAGNFIGFGSLLGNVLIPGQVLLYDRGPAREALSGSMQAVGSASTVSRSGGARLGIWR